MIKLHVGCGKRNFGDDWIHIDGVDFPHIKYRDITNLSQFRNGTVDLIYASHVIAYFSCEEIVMVLNEWKRVLKPNGILRLATPDFYKMTYLYQRGECNLGNIVGPLYGKMQMNNTEIFHKTVYDIMSLSKLLMEVGFKDIERYDWRQTNHAQFDDHSQAYLPKMNKQSGILISLNVECKK